VSDPTTIEDREFEVSEHINMMADEKLIPVVNAIVASNFAIAESIKNLEDTFATYAELLVAAIRDRR